MLLPREDLEVLALDELGIDCQPIACGLHFAPDHFWGRIMAEQPGKESMRMNVQHRHPPPRA
jgi:hypothetical protein